MLPQREAFAYARLRTGYGCCTNPGAWLIAHVCAATLYICTMYSLILAAVEHGDVSPFDPYIIHDTLLTIDRGFAAMVCSSTVDFFYAA